MHKKTVLSLLILTLSTVLFGCHQQKVDKESRSNNSNSTKEQLIHKYQAQVPTQWGEQVTAVKTPYIRRIRWSP